MNNNKVLIIEDEALIAATIKQELVKKGYTVTGIAHSAEIAVKLYENTKPDLILVDIRLQGDIDGISIVEKIKSSNSVPVIYMTAYSEEVTVERAKHTQPDGYILKPININELLLTIDLVLYKYKMNTKLKESEEKYRFYIDHSPDAVFITDETGKFIEVNSAGEKITGYSESDLLEMRTLDILTPESMEDGKLHFEMIRNTGIASGEFAFKHKNGKVCYISINAMKLSDERYISFCKDTTERKKNEIELSESEQKFRMLSEQSLMGIAIIQENRFQYVNSTLADIFEYSVKEMTEWERIDYAKLVYPEDLSFAIEQVEKKQRGNNKDIVIQYTVRLKSKSIGFKWIEIYSKTITYNSKPADFVTLIDITEKKSADEKLQRWAHIFEHTEAGIVISGADGKAFGQMNPAFARMHGYTINELRGKLISEVFTSEEREKIPGHIDMANKKGHHIFESVHLRKDGTTFPVIIDLSVIREKEGDISYRVANVRDITELKNVEKEKRQLEEEKTSAIDSERTRIGRDLHDSIGQKLTALSFMLESVKTKISNKIFPDTAIIDDILSTLTEITSESQDISRGLYPVDLEKNDLLSLFSLMALNIEHTFGIKCTVTLTGEIKIYSITKSLHIYYIINEAINNAVKHGKAEHIDLSIVQIENRIVFKVIDDGIGIQDMDKKGEVYAGIGFRTMQNRANIIMGNLELGNNKNGGFHVILSLEES